MSLLSVQRVFKDYDSLIPSAQGAGRLVSISDRASGVSCVRSMYLGYSFLRSAAKYH